MNAWEQVQETIEYIEQHIGEEITIESLANMAALSQFYYQRLFHRLVGKTVIEYIKLRRLAKAKDALLKENERIIDIAVEYGFKSHEHFTRSFKETFGITPVNFRKNPLPLNCMTKPELLLNYIVIDEGVPLVTQGIVIEIRREAIDKTVHYVGLVETLPVEYGEGLGNESGLDPLSLLWDKVHEGKENNVINSVTQEEVGVMLPSLEEGFYRYFAGARTNDTVVVSDYTVWDMPKGNYVVCYFEAENFDALVMDALYKAQQYLFSTWLPKHQIQTEALCVERYETHTHDTNKMEVWVKIQ